MDEWWREGKISEELSSRLLRKLQGDPVPALCEYLRAFEKSTKKIKIRIKNKKRKSVKTE